MAMSKKSKVATKTKKRKPKSYVRRDPNPAPEDALLCVAGFFPDTVAQPATMGTALLRLIDPFLKGWCQVACFHTVFDRPGGRILSDNTRIRKVLAAGIDSEFSAQAKDINPRDIGLSNGRRLHISIGGDHDFHMDATIPPQVVMWLNITELGVDHATQQMIAQQALGIMADGGAWTGLAEYGKAGGYLNWGLVFTAYPSFPAPWEMWTDWCHFGRSDTRRERVRRISWATMLDAKLASRLPPTWESKFLALDWGGGPPTQKVVHCDSGARIILLSDRPEDMLEVEGLPDAFQMPVVCNAAWLRELFYTHRLV
jgi:hypothetical protein